MTVSQLHVEPSSQGDVMREARVRFLQLLVEAQQTHLADNLDPLFHPWGHPLPDPATTGERIAEQLDVLDRCGAFWRGLGDAKSRGLFLRFLAYRALGPAHVRLELEPEPYRRSVIGLSAGLVEQGRVLAGPGVPPQWHFHLFNLVGAGYPLRVIGQPLPLASTYLFSQYAYRDGSVDARPRPGDVALDVGGCWGESALWLAHAVGPEGAVHSFEPTPQNRKLLEKNLELNPVEGSRVHVWGAPLADRPDETVWIRDVAAAGATMQAERDAADSQMVELRTDTIDSLVSRGELPRVDFLKVDVEGADLGVLQGAAETIRSQRPRLALACYHKPDDLAVIPDFVESLGVPYRWYLQCSTMTDVDIVAFGVPVG